MEFIDFSKSFIENLYFISGFILALMAIVGIYHLVLTKRAIKINSARHAADLAAAQVELYCSKTIPLQDIYYKSKMDNNIKKIEYEVGEFSLDHIYSTFGKEKVKIILQERINIMLDHFLPVINSMEAFAIYFTKGVADEEIAFSASGETFCHSVKSLYIEISFCRGKDSKAFENTVLLYKLWSERIKKEKLTKSKEVLENKLKQISEKKINPIGT